MDLAFPHHENERAQAVGLGRAFARHWVHNGWVMVGGEKMSKSLGNFTSLTDLLERADARAYRLLVLRAHYRSPIEVTPSTVEQAEKALARLDDLARRFDARRTGGGLTAGRRRSVAGADAGAVASFIEHMDDDLDTPGALAEIFDLARRAHSAADAGDDDEGSAPGRHRGASCAARWAWPSAVREPELDAETAALVAERDAGRAAGDYDRADAIRRRARGHGAGWSRTGPEGTRLHRRPGS